MIHILQHEQILSTSNGGNGSSGECKNVFLSISKRVPLFFKALIGSKYITHSLRKYPRWKIALTPSVSANPWARGYLTATVCFTRFWAPRLTPCTAPATSSAGRRFPGWELETLQRNSILATTYDTTMHLGIKVYVTSVPFQYGLTVKASFS